jgi:multimeric flavodoxin WrbA
MILFLNSSPRKNGVTAALLKAMRDALRPAHEIEWVDVNGLSLKPCTGCLRCRPDKPCALPPDDAHRVGELIRRADALVIGAPTYWGNMSGPLKTLFDRNVPVIELLGASPFPKPMQKGKPAAVVVSSAARFPYNQLPSQSRGAIRAVKTVLKSAGYRILGIQNVVERRFRKSSAHSDRYEARAAKTARALGRRAGIRARNEGRHGPA